MDQAGNLALGFSASSATIEPEIRYATRLATDPLNTLTAEALLFNGTGGQIGTSSRWGDYSSMTVDPVDDCTFWYTQEYYAIDDDFNWRTRIGNFKFESCGGGGGDIVLEARVKAQGNKHQVQMRWSPADGGSVDVLRNGVVTRDDSRRRTIQETISEPVRENSPTRSVKQTQAIAPMKSPSTSRSRPIRLLEGS